MHDEQAFLQAMLEHSDDVSFRLVFADWLEERNDPRAELIRLLHTLTQSVEVPDRNQLEDRLHNLLESGIQPVGPFWTNSIGMRFAWIPAGTFSLGSPENEAVRDDNETRHKVTFTRGFYMSVHLVSQEQWQAVIGTNSSHFKGEKTLPVDSVSWDDCQEFINKLCEKDKKPYRLPTEAEWEYACRAGTTTPFYFGDTITDQANYEGFYTYGKGPQGVFRKKTTPVGSFPPNAWGLYDMHGNVWEWCADWFGEYPNGNAVDPQGPNSGEYRVLRGGWWGCTPEICRSAYRLVQVPGIRRQSCYGFRLCFCLD